MRFYKYFIQGIVQGVGFRPYIYKKAKQFNLKGYVKNIGNGVEVLINDKDFIFKLNDLPPLAKITNYIVDECSNFDENSENQENYNDFFILKSSSNSFEGETILPSDVSICEDCLKELRDPNNKRYNYYFITCTNCGPRFTIIDDYPYDRPLTSMNDFEMCEDCKKEYTDPLNRRYHAQTIACPKCGPKLFFKKKDQIIEKDYEAIKKTAELLKNNNLVLIKGIGGIHICSILKNVNKIRELLNRKHKPFAIMVKNIEMAEKICYVNEYEKKLLLSKEKPILVLRKKNNALFKEVSELDSLGTMLPYTGLHYLLFDFIDEPLIMTSFNLPGEPMLLDFSFDKIELISNSKIDIEYYLEHERKIINRCDDSVIKVISNNDGNYNFFPVFLRRSRGFTPIPIKLPIKCRDTIALGAELNNVICCVKNNNAFLSQYIGQTQKEKTFDYFKETIENFIKLTRLKPEIIVCDLHPEYNSSKYAIELSKKYNSKLIMVQHHEAHIASVAAEHNILSDLIGIALDGLGYGYDGSIFGGEIFLFKDKKFFRIGHLEEQFQFGDTATIYPKKMLFSILNKFLEINEIIKTRLYEKNEAILYKNIIKENFNLFKTTSTGRILDSIAALLGICDYRDYDGRPAMLLESFAYESFLKKDYYELEPIINIKENIKKEYNFSDYKNTINKYILMTTPLIKFIYENLKKDKSIKNKKRLAATAHIYLANGFLKIAEIIKKEHNKKMNILFSGGVAYNSIITYIMLKNNVLINKEIPCGDGGISYGQSYLGNLI